MMFLVLGLVGLMVLVATVAPPEKSRSGRGTATETPTPQASALIRDPDAFDVTATLSAAPGEKEQTVEAELGDRVQIVVEGNALDSVALGELRLEELEAGIPARFELLAETPGSYPLVLIASDRRIGTLEIR